MGFEVSVLSAQRIISLVPSQTELLFDLGLGNRIVGVTKFCAHPEEARLKTIVGGTKNFWMDVIDQLQPDLIIGNKEENYKDGIEQLRHHYPVWMSDIFTLEDALQMMQTMGELTHTVAKANQLVNSITEEFNSLHPSPIFRTLYLIWKKPWMAVGRNTFIHAMLEKIGLMNTVREGRYPELTSEQIQQLSPQLILLSSEPYPFQKQHMEELKTLVPRAKVMLVDGEMFSWYGSRLLKAPAYFKGLQDQLS